MKTNRLFILAATSLLMLTACGSKGGKTSESQQQSSQQQSQETSSEASQQQSSEQSSEAEQSSQQQSSEAEQSSEQSSEAEQSSEQSSGSSGDQIEITIWTTYNDSYQTVLNNCAEELQQLYPNIKVNNVKKSGSYDDLRLECINGFAVDNYPDMVAAYPDSVADFINNAKALDIGPYMNDTEIGWTSADLNDVNSAYITEYSFPGTYSLPASKSTEAMYYNQDKLIGIQLAEFDNTINKGLPLNDNYLQNLTWEELMDKLVPALEQYDAKYPEANLIKKTTDGDWGYVAYDSDDNFFITLAEQYDYGYTAINKKGRGELLFNNDNMKNLMKKFVGYQKKNYFCTQNTLNTRANNRFKEGSALFSIGSTGGVFYQFNENDKHNIGVAHLPYPEAGSPYIISQGPDFAFLNHDSSDRARATWLFYKLFTSAKYNIAWSTISGYSPIRYSVLEHEDYQDYANPDDKPEKTIDRLYAYNAIYSASVIDDLFTSPVFKGSSEARNQVGTIFAACAVSNNLDADIDQIFQTAYDNTVLKM